MENIAVYGEQVAGRAFEIKKELENLLNRVDLNTLDCAELLVEVRNNNYYLQWGLNSFKEYTETLKFKPSKTQYLLKIIDVMETIKVLRQDYEHLGISKLREITSLDPNSYYVDPKTGKETLMADYILGLVDTAGDMPYAEVKETVAKLKGKGTNEEFVWFNVQLKKSIKDLVLIPALERAKMQIGSVGYDSSGNAVDASDGAALEVLAIEFLNSQQEEKDE